MQYPSYIFPICQLAYIYVNKIYVNIDCPKLNSTVNHNDLLSKYEKCGSMNLFFSQLINVDINFFNILQLSLLVPFSQTHIHKSLRNVSLEIDHFSSFPRVFKMLYIVLDYIFSLTSQEFISVYVGLVVLSHYYTKSGGLFIIEQ